MSLANDWTLYLWEPCLSPHKLDLFKALQNSPRVCRIVYVAESPLPAEREALGWSVAPLSADECVISPSTAAIEELVVNSPPDAVHIFSGIHNPPMIVEAIRSAIRNKRRFGIMHEPRAFEGAKGWLRFAHSWASEGALRRNADFVLAIGRNGPPWFSGVGYDPVKIFPFAYFLPFHAGRSLKKNGPPRVSFLGRLTKAKGFGLLLDALPLLRNNVVIEVAGGGPEEQAARLAEAGSNETFHYRGVLQMAEVPDFLAQTDILVVPSTTRDDGWGAVISEALLQGAAVVATDRVGGSICLKEDWRGRVVTCLNAQNLARAIDDVIDRNHIDEHWRSRRSNWARERLTGETGARALLATLGHIYTRAPRPLAFYED